ncbi:uncharacterized protein LOC129918167 [Episyrphus balteatus]|uniref:uncharacterized protein LOC129918167 n=1 Tax=Episyrphus balteatus TaxID=286459 RepID=UPI002484F787|nr:uncharacterized protein LOC129918167 [Episyrphus balteatus]
MRDLHGLTLPVVYRGSRPAIIVSKDTNDEKIIGGFVGNIIKAFAKRHNAKLNTSNARDVITPIRAEPALIVSENSNGEKVIGGFVGNMFKAFAKRHNAKLNTSNANSNTLWLDMHKCVLNGTVEITSTDSVFLQDSIKWFSYPFIQYDWGVMVPVEPSIPIYKMFAFVFHWKAFAITILVAILLSILTNLAAKIKGTHQACFKCDLFFNIDCFRGIIGQSFSEAPEASCTIKIIYLIIFLLAIMIVTLYDAFLQSFMTEPPKDKMITSFDDLQLSGLKICTTQSDIEIMWKLQATFMKNYSNSFVEFNSGACMGYVFDKYILAEEI